MEQRFGLTFQVFAREFVLDKRRERGYGVNPWTTHTRFIVSHALLRDPAYAEPLRDWLGDFAPGSLLILDEAHNAGIRARSTTRSSTCTSNTASCSACWGASGPRASSTTTSHGPASAKRRTPSRGL